MRTARTPGGYFLIEVVVVSIIVVIALLGILDEAASSIRGNRVADQQGTATALGQAQIEQLESLPFANVVSGSDASTLAADGSSGGIYSRSWQVTASTANGVNTKQITMTVNWPQGTGTASVALTTLFADIPDYGPGFPTVVAKSWRRQ